jgi:TonB family protein
MDPVAFSACMPRDLDRIPTPIRIVQPALPAAPGRRSQGARVTVKFFIDDHGRVRLPRISSLSRAANEELAGSAMGDAAVAAVSQWQFEPPLSRGKPTIVLVAQDFNFPAAGP